MVAQLIIMFNTKQQYSKIIYREQNFRRNHSVYIYVIHNFLRKLSVLNKLKTQIFPVSYLHANDHTAVNRKLIK